MKCPGQDMQYWKGDAIYEVKCPNCMAMVEFYKDDTTRRCHECDHRFVNPKLDFGCATYCQFAEQCIGSLPEEFVMQQDSLLKDKVAVEMKRHFGRDFTRIRFSSQLGRYAEVIGRTVEGVNLAVVLCSAYLYRIGSTAAVEKHGEADEVSVRQENSAAGLQLLERLGAPDDLISQVVDIIGPERSAQEDWSLEKRVVEDAYRLTLLEDMLKQNSIGEDIQTAVNSLFFETAREEAGSIVSRLRQQENAAGS